MIGRRVGGILAVLALAHGGSGAAVLCTTKAGTLLVRTACGGRYFAIDAAAIGAGLPQGPPGVRGPSGAPGDARGWAHVSPSGFVGARAHLEDVTKPETGVYCLTPDDSIDVTSSLALATPEFGASFGGSLVVYVQFPPATCAEGTFEVRTVDFDGSPSDSVAFHFVVI